MCPAQGLSDKSDYSLISIAVASWSWWRLQFQWQLVAVSSTSLQWGCMKLCLLLSSGLVVLW